MELKKGDIIRRKLNTGLLVGSYKVIDDVEKHGVYAHDIPLNSLGSLYYTKETISVINYVVLKHTDAEIKSIIDDRLSWTQHILNKSWEDALKKYISADVRNRLLCVVLQSTKSHIIVSEPVFAKVHYNDKCYVKLSFLRILDSTIR